MRTATAMVMHTDRRCQDPSTGQPVACSNTSYSGSGGHGYYYSASSIGNKGSGVTSTSSVGRGGFGSAGYSFHAGP